MTKRLFALLVCLLAGLLACGCTIGISNNPAPPDKCYPAGRAC